MRLSGNFIWRNTVSLGYPVLESFLSVVSLLDEAILCVDPESDSETLKLADALVEKFPIARRVDFIWPKNAPGNGARIGIASQFGLNQCTSEYVLNVQADELYPPQLSRAIKENWQESAKQGIECFSMKVLNLEHNMQQFQGGGDYNWQNGAGYNRAIKLFKKCPAIKFANDGWSMENCGVMAHISVSEAFPVVHAHDNFRDHLVSIRQNAADQIWTDRQNFGHYKQSADTLEATQEQWYNDTKWTATDSPFVYLLPDFAKRLLGKVRYEVDYSLLDQF